MKSVSLTSATFIPRATARAPGARAARVVLSNDLRRKSYRHECILPRFVLQQVLVASFVERSHRSASMAQEHCPAATSFTKFTRSSSCIERVNRVLSFILTLQMAYRGVACPPVAFVSHKGHDERARCRRRFDRLDRGELAQW